MTLIRLMMTRLSNCWKALTGKDDMPDKDDVEAIAAIVGMTSSSLNAIDDQLVSTSANLQQSKDAWNPNAILKQGITSTGNLEGVSERPSEVPAHTEAVAYPQLAQQAQPAQQPMQQPIQQAYAQPQAFITDPQILKRLDRIEQVLNSLSVTEEKIMKSLLKTTTKQITIRFDDSKSSK
jgi:hypothetical protein